MSDLVLGHCALLHALQDGALLLNARDGAHDGHVKLLVADLCLAAPPSKQGSLVHEVGQVSACEACGSRGNVCDAHIACKRQAPPLKVDLEDLLTTNAIGPLHRYPPIKPPWSQQCRVQHIWPVGCCDADDHVVLVAVKAVQLREQLVQCLLPLVIAHTAQAHVTTLGNRINLIDEHDGWGLLACRGKELAHPHGAHAHVQLNKLGCRDAEEGHISLACYSSRQQGLASTGGAHQQHTTGGSGSELGEALWCSQVLHNLSKLLLRLIHTRYISKHDWAAAAS
mmetsp:Transcript_15987/g.34544  ORF Transcript_15987/g.34544 Transcript_15987/m.34544 type:complete len:282 (+) Transcript_15987:2167-3012(+)